MSRFSGVRLWAIITSARINGGDGEGFPPHCDCQSPPLFVSFSGALAPDEFCQVQNSLRVQVLCSPILTASVRHCTALEQQTSAKLCGVIQEYKATFAEGATYIFLGGYHVGYQPTF